MDHIKGVLEFDILDHPREWWEGFEAGLVYVLMVHQYPVIKGECARNNEEQLFLMARQSGYNWEWHPLPGNEKTDVTFVLVNQESDGEDD